jgi:hypothetical protein
MKNLMTDRVLAAGRADDGDGARGEDRAKVGWAVGRHIGEGLPAVDAQTINDRLIGCRGFPYSTA